MAINFDDAFTKNYMDSMYPQPPEEPAQDTMLAAGPVTSDAPQAFVGTRLNVPKAGQPQPTTQDRQRLGIQLFDALAAMPKGAVQATVGLPGDLESIGRTVLDYFGYNVNQETALPTSEDISKKLESTFGPVVPKGQTTIVPTAERERAAKSGETIGEFLPAPGIPEAVVRGGKLIRRGIQATKDMPVGMSTQMVGEGVNDLGFYSAAKQAVDSIQQPKGTGAQFLAQIEKTPGVKPEEIKWTGLDDFLKSKKSVTKAEVQEYLTRNAVKVEETRLDVQGNQTVDDFGFNERSREIIDDYEYIDMRAEDIMLDYKNDAKYLDSIRNEVIDDLGLTDDVLDESMIAKVDETVDERLQELAQKQASDEYYDNPYYRYTEPNGYEIVGNNDVGYSVLSPTGRNLDSTNRGIFDFDEAQDLARNDALEQGYISFEDEGAKYASYVLPGGTNYREILIRMPNKDGDEFVSGHFDESNILAHLRVDDRVIDGKKTLFVEEVQSDWHQAGRKKGYQTPESAELRNELTVKISESYAEKQKLRDKRSQLLKADKENTPEYIDLDNQIKDIEKQQVLLQEQLRKTGDVPDAPFKTTWHELAMKRAIQMAAEGGYDRIAFTTGKQQAERYSLSKQVNEITATHFGGERYRVEAIDKNGKPAIVKIVESENELDSLIGKELARKIVEDTKGKTVGKTYSGLELDVGGEGMKGFYDKILPKFLDKYAKKWDAKTGMTELSIDGKKDPVHYFDVTPKMKESVLTKGQPLFAIGAGGAAVQQEENQ